MGTRILIEGIGSVGGLLAGELLARGHDLTLVTGNAAITAAINARGIAIDTPERKFSVASKAYTSLTELPAGSRFDSAWLVMMAGAVDQFVVLFGHDHPATANIERDHFGLNVNSLAELQELLGRAKVFARTNPDVEITDYAVSEPRVDVLPHKLHRFYVRFVTPCPLEVQYYERV